jgi:hypothetical protein
MIVILASLADINPPFLFCGTILALGRTAKLLTGTSFNSGEHIWEIYFY